MTAGEERKSGVAKAKIEAMQDRLEQEANADDPHLDAYRDLLHAAHSSSNGSAHKIEALSETVGLLAVVLSQEKLREPERTRQTFQSLHDAVCPVQRLVYKDDKGVTHMPWEKPQEADSSISIPLFGFRATGEAAKIVAIVATLLILAVGFMAWQNKSMRGEIVSSVVPQIVQQLRSTPAAEE